ncbi:MAG: DUF1189 family protein [Candidatus Taylorbacteria bacterium]
MKLFQTIKDSINNPEFYRAEKNASFKKAFGYFFKLTLLSALCLTLILSAKMIPSLVVGLSEESINKVLSYYPQELEVTIKDGHASTNVKEPYFLLWPSEFVQASSNPNAGTSHLPKNLLVIDTKGVFAIDTFSTYDTSLFLTKDYFVSAKNEGQELSIQKLPPSLNVTINRAQLSTWVEKIRPWLVCIIPLFIVGLFVAIYLANIVLSLFMILILSVIIWIVALIRKQNFSYSQIYKLGLYGVTVVVMLRVLYFLLGVPSFWFIDSVIFLLLMFLNTKKIGLKT